MKEEKSAPVYFLIAGILLGVTITMILNNFFYSQSLETKNHEKNVEIIEVVEGKDREEEKVESDGKRPRMIIGFSKIEFKGGETIGVQVDGDEEIAENMAKWANIEIMLLTPARAKYNEATDSYYFADGKENFPFFPFSAESHKIEHETVYPAEDENENFERKENWADLICPSTRGFNMVAEQAFINKENLFLVMADMNSKSEAEAALSLSRQGLNIYAPADQFTRTLINYREKYPAASGTILPSAPIKQTEDGFVIGDQPITVYLDERIIIQYIEHDENHNTAWLYFQELQREYILDFETIRVTTKIGQVDRVTEIASLSNTNVIAVIVKNEADYIAITKWLRENPLNRAILFHSTIYSPGMRLFRDFPDQTTFGDLNPLIIIIEEEKD